MGGGGADSIVGVSLAATTSTYSGDVIAGGGTTSVNLPATSGSAQPAATGSGDAFAAAMSPDLQSPEVELDLAVNAPSSVKKGKTFTMVITVSNNGTSAAGKATNVYVFDSLNGASTTGQISYVSATTSQGSCSENTATAFVTCPLGDIVANGGTATVTLTLKAQKVGTVNSDISTSAEEALSASSPGKVTQTVTVEKQRSSGGGALEWPALLLLSVISLFMLRRRRLAMQRD